MTKCKFCIDGIKFKIENINSKIHSYTFYLFIYLSAGNFTMRKTVL